MKTIRLTIAFILCTILSMATFAQGSIEEEAITVPIISPNFSFSIPGGDMSEQYGTHFTIGGAFLTKTSKSILLGLHADFIFGNNVKNGEDILVELLTEKGFIIDKFGGPAEVYLYERGFHISARAGKLWPVIGPNPNSGIFFTIGAGYLQHKVRVENIEGSAPQIGGDYKKGYDKLRGGPALSEFIGYMHLSSSRLLNFFGGLEFTQVFTQPLRPYDFSLMKENNSDYFDLTFGIKLGWMIPVYKRTPDKFYYY